MYWVCLFAACILKLRSIFFKIKHKFLDEWDEVKTACCLAEKCDKYESVRGNVWKIYNNI